MHRTAAETREHVLQIAHELFYWNGIRATGVDKVAAEAGVAPTTLYRLFASKDELVAAYVERADQETRAWVTAATEPDDRDPRERIRELFHSLEKQTRQPCRGCTFLMALSEFPDPALPAHRNAVAAKAWIRNRLGELTKELSLTVRVDDTEALADKLALVIEGVHASAQALGAHGPAKQARALADSIVAEATS